MKKTLLTLLFGCVVTAQAQDIKFVMEPSYPPFEMTEEKGEIIVLMWILQMLSVKR
ncbi:ABC transporter arginine-binding protein precursor [Mannheimia haemolytica]|uniref:ABC transporter arginine-binding protein n=1 Tax=Mannheimia haemolytica TaxID=75985 RepID=A0A378N1N4_MANHA|nr:ABC transporter arginine-binding protein precursor [Mannheimia haemolytica]